MIWSAVFQVDAVSRCCVHFTSKRLGQCANVVDIHLGRCRTMQRDFPRCQYNQRSSLFDIWGSVAVYNCPVSADILLWKNPCEVETGEPQSWTWQGTRRRSPSRRNEPFTSERHQNNDYNFCVICSDVIPVFFRLHGFVLRHQPRAGQCDLVLCWNRTFLSQRLVRSLHLRPESQRSQTTVFQVHILHQIKSRPYSTYADPVTL